MLLLGRSPRDLIRDLFKLNSRPAAPPALQAIIDSTLAISISRSQLGLTTGVQLRGPEGAQRPRASSAATAELARALCR